MADKKLARGAHLGGSFPEPDPEKVFRMCGDILGERLQRVTDGEYGERGRWVAHQFERLSSHPQLEVVARPPDASYGPPVLLNVRPGVNAKDVVFDGLGYVAPVQQSFELLDRLQSEGAVPTSWRFQVGMGTPFGTMGSFVAEDIAPDLEPAYEAAMLTEIDAICAAIPHDRLAIQWDVAVEFSYIEEDMPLDPWFPDTLGGILERLSRISNRVPSDVELGFHLCYGEFGHKHFMDPKDTGHLVEVANGICAGVKRPVNWVHMPVLRGAFDDAYYQPLSGLDLHPETELYLGLIHRTGGVDAIWRRINIARTFVDDFGVAAECGFSQRPPETVPEVLQLHAEVSEPRSHP